LSTIILILVDNTDLIPYKFIPLLSYTMVTTHTLKINTKKIKTNKKIKLNKNLKQKLTLMLCKDVPFILSLVTSCALVTGFVYWEYCEVKDE